MAFSLETTTSDYMSIMVTHECNRNCLFCVDQLRGLLAYITLDNVKNALVFAKEKGIKDILLVGGEPTLHPEIVTIAKMCHESGFNVILTTNFDNLEVVYSLDKYVNSFNFSYYGQRVFPDPEKFKHADLTLSTLVFKGRFDSQKKLDKFIDTHASNYTIKFSTLTNCNEYTNQRSAVPFLDDLPNCNYKVLFNEIIGQEYRGCLIKRYDKVINKQAHQSYKCHTNGIINQTWESESE